MLSSHFWLTVGLEMFKEWFYPCHLPMSVHGKDSWAVVRNPIHSTLLGCPLSQAAKCLELAGSDPVGIRWKSSQHGDYTWTWNCIILGRNPQISPSQHDHWSCWPGRREHSWKLCSPKKRFPTTVVLVQFKKGCQSHDDQAYQGTFWYRLPIKVFHSSVFCNMFRSKLWIPIDEGELCWRF